MNPPDGGRYERRLPVLILLLTIVTLGVGIAALRAVDEHLVQRAGNSMALAAADIADKLDLLFVERSGDIRMMAQSALLQGHDIAAVTRHLHAVQAAHPVYQGLAVTDARGMVVAATDPFTVRKDRSGEPWFHAVRKAGELHVQDAHPSADSEEDFAIAFTAPITGTQREFLGFITAQVGLPSLKYIFEQTVRRVELEHAIPCRSSGSF